jgi:hypothetical protein
LISYFNVLAQRLQEPITESAQENKCTDDDDGGGDDGDDDDDDNNNNNNNNITVAIICNIFTVASQDKL